MTPFAIIETGGKQYKVAQGSKVKVEKLAGEAGGSFVFDKVLLLATGSDVKIGAPYISGAKISATIVKQARAPKVTTFKYHSKTRYRKTKGHRQHYTEVEIASI